MRRLETVAVAVTVTCVLSGCANFRDREWGTCAIAGAVVGGAAGGIVAGTVINNEGDPTDGERAGAIVGGVVGGAALGALLGHVLCDPIRVEEPPKVAQVPPAPEPKPEPPDLSGETHFAFDSAQLTPAGEATLDQTVRMMQDHPDLRVACEGYTDSIGTEAYNLGLSKRRAESACGYLERQGVSPSRLEIRYFGEADPIASNDTEEGRAQNRRVEIDAIE